MNGVNAGRGHVGLERDEKVGGLPLRCKTIHVYIKFARFVESKTLSGSTKKECSGQNCHLGDYLGSKPVFTVGSKIALHPVTRILAQVNPVPRKTHPQSPS